MFKKFVPAAFVAIFIFPLFASAANCPNLTRNLSLGSRGSDVVQLQQFLISQNVLVAGNDSGYFGRLTQAAVQQFQCRAMNLCSGSPSANGYGVVGQRTRSAIAIACTAGTSQTSNQTNLNNPSTSNSLIESLLAQIRALQQQMATLQNVSATTTVTTSCTPLAPQTQTLSCPSGQTGSITQTRISACPGPVWSNWTTALNTCAATPISTTCTPLSPQTQTLSCPSGQTGSITQTRVSTCASGATSPTRGSWSTTANTCSYSYFEPLPQNFLVGVNTNLYKPCDGLASASNALDDRWILQDYGKPGIRPQIQTQLAVMRANGVESLRVMVSIYGGAPGRHDGVLSMTDPSERSLLLTNIDTFTQDAKSAGFKRITYSFNTLGLNSPLDYVRRWTLPAYCGTSTIGECATPIFDPSKLEENFNLIANVRSAVKKYETSEFQILFDLMNEANTSLSSTDSNARAYVENFWKKYVERFGGNDAGFSSGLGWVDIATRIPKPYSSGFEALLQAFTRSDVAFPKIYMVHDYYFSDSFDDTDLISVNNLLEKYNIPLTSRNIQIAESFYNYPATAAAAYHLQHDSGLKINELLVWPTRYEDVFSNSCAQSVSIPYSVSLQKAIRLSGSAVSDRIDSLGYYAPNSALWVKLKATQPTPLVVSIYDSQGKMLRSDAVWRRNDDTSLLMNISASTAENNLLGTQGLQLDVWFADGSHTGKKSIDACGADYVRCK